jgi:hypothetical protein
MVGWDVSVGSHDHPGPPARRGSAPPRRLAGRTTGWGRCRRAGRSRAGPFPRWLEHQTAPGRRIAPAAAVADPDSGQRDGCRRSSYRTSELGVRCFTKAAGRGGGLALHVWPSPARYPVIFPGQSIGPRLVARGGRYVRDQSGVRRRPEARDPDRLPSVTSSGRVA